MEENIRILIQSGMPTFAAIVSAWLMHVAKERSRKSQLHAIKLQHKNATEADKKHKLDDALAAATLLKVQGAKRIPKSTQRWLGATKVNADFLSKAGLAIQSADSKTRTLLANAIDACRNGDIEEFDAAYDSLVSSNSTTKHALESSEE